MHRLALHWQILIGMVAGAVIGLAFNGLASTKTRTIEQAEMLPDGITQAKVEDSSARTIIHYTRSDGNEVQRIIDPVSRDKNDFPNLDDLKKVDPAAVDIYQRHGVSTAKRWGGWFKRIGGLFLRMLQMVAVPLIITSLMTGILGLGTGDGVGRMFRHTLTYYLGTSSLAIVTGLLAVNIFRPGLKTDEFVAAAPTMTEAESLGEVLFQQLEAMIPSNPLQALVTPNFLSIIAFTILFSLFTLRVGGDVAKRVKDFATTGFDVMMAMTTAIIRLAPVGVLFLMAYVTATQGSSVFSVLGYYCITVAVALAFHAVVTLPLILYFVAKRNPLEYAKAMSPALLTAFSSASSNGTLPVTLTCVEERARISNRTGSFVLPLGATINMDGTALYEAVAVLFIAQLHFGFNLPLTEQLIVAITALLASVGAAGIPHAGLVMMVIILQAVGLPLELQGIILAVDRVLDMDERW